MKIVAYSSRPDFFVNQQGEKCSLKQAVANKKAVDNYGCGRNGWLGGLFHDSICDYKPQAAAQPS